MSERALSIRLNGEPQGIPPGCTLDALLASLGIEGRRIAVAINRDVIPRSAFAEHTLRGGDRVEILEAVGGG